MRRLVLLTPAFVAAASPAAAASRPLAGARYFGALGHGRGYVEFTVSDDRRSVVPNAGLDANVESDVFYRRRCGGVRWGLGGPGVFARAGSGRMRIARSGSFGITDRRGKGRRFKLSGTFSSGGKRAAGTFQMRTVGGCTTGPVRFKVRFTGQRHLIRGTCNPPGTRTLAQTDAARVYEERYISDDGTKGTAAYGCLNAVGKRFFLGLTQDPSVLGPLTFGGNFVGYGVADCPSDCIASGVDVVDLSTGRTKHNLDASQPFGAQVDSMVLAPSGSVAWVAGGQLRKRERRVTTLLDPGPGIDAKSLAFTPPDQLSWNNGSVPLKSTLR